MVVKRVSGANETATMPFRVEDECHHDHLHKVSRSIIDDNQVIVLETLNISGMMRNHCLAKSIADVSLAELVRQITYKAEWYDRTVIKVDRWFPSSKTCSE